MDKKATTVAIIVGGVLLAVLIATGQAPLQATRQEWKLKSSDSPGMVHFTVERWKPGNHWSTSTDVRFANFRGLSRDTIESGGPAKFEYVQDAGRLLCQGSFSWAGDRGPSGSNPIPNTRRS
ncbi:MAG: hypothetical protein LAQ69_04380 [Acidobacteriia bacterium]|nr:hypothetical protein [Terriglobia bacterium]